MYQMCNLPVLPLLGHTHGAALAAGGLGVLTAHTETPEVTQTTVAPHPLETLEVLTELLVENVGVGLSVLAVLDVLLPVKEPIGDLELTGVLDDVDDLVDLIVGQLAGPVIIANGEKSARMNDRKTKECNANLLFRSTSAFLHTTLAKRRPTPLMAVRAKTIFCLPSMFVLSTRRMCWKSSCCTKACNRSINEDGFRLGYRPFGSHGSLATGTPHTTNRIRHPERDQANHLCWGAAAMRTRERERKEEKLGPGKILWWPFPSRQDNSRQIKKQIWAPEARQLTLQ